MVGCASDSEQVVQKLTLGRVDFVNEPQQDVPLVNIEIIVWAEDVGGNDGGSHSLQYYISVTSAPIAGVLRYTITGYLDGLQYGKYNSKIPFVQPLIPSLKALTEHLELQTKYAQEFLEYQKKQVAYFTSIFNKTSGGHIYQRKFVCELHEDGTTDRYQEFAFNGREVVTYDKERLMYVPTTPESRIVTERWNKYEYYDAIKNKLFMENDCIQHMKLYLPHVMAYLERKVPPNVKISSSESESGTKLHCLVYGFYPRDVEVKWIKNETDEIYSEESAEIRPNPDGTYQIRVSVEVTPEEGATYSCHVDHSSLENILVVPFVPVESNKKNILYIIIPVGSALLVLLIVLGVFIYRKVPSGHQSVSTEDGD
ncbi:hypothetical protein XELAEV_18000448mg [Xenopus laevis]|uniref:Ig-like domain-containing protein n=1 Tax=Xenopus laevis TaxID=8355 RepID=A0A974BQH0_XENLA|nr:hypothetical protein XELAEV_18000448mg [Xenopus laevis]